MAEQKAAGFKDTRISSDQTVDGDHSRIEAKTTTVIHDVAWLQERHNWPGLSAVVVVESEREIGDKVERETHFRITFLRRLATFRPRIRGKSIQAYCMNQPWLTMRDPSGHGIGSCSRKEKYRISDIIRGSKLAIYRVFEHHLLDDLVLRNTEFPGLLGDLLIHQRCADEARADHVRPHVVLDRLLSHYLAQADQPMLGSHVRRLEDRSLLGVNRAHVNDTTRACLIHVPKAGFRREKRTVQVNSHHPLPVSEWEIDYGFDDLDAGITNQNIDPTKLCECFANRFID